MLADLEPAISRRRAEVSHDDELPTIWADATGIAEVLRELLANALKFSASTPRIHVAARQTDAAWEVSVGDEGIGIDPAQHERAFELLQCLNARDDYPGTGAGLAVARELIRAHGGAIRVESAPGTGSVFTFSLPRRTRPADSADGDGS